MSVRVIWSAVEADAGGGGEAPLGLLATRGDSGVFEDKNYQKVDPNLRIRKDLSKTLDNCLDPEARRQHPTLFTYRPDPPYLRFRKPTHLPKLFH